MLLLLFSILPVSIVSPISVHDHIFDRKKFVKRQISLDEIIQGAIKIVQPIFDTQQAVQSNLMKAGKPHSEPFGEREAEILGVPKHSTLDDVPICKTNSKICEFISCSAHNFKNDESISNLNLAAQILADTKLRKAITSDPSTLLMICHEQGLSSTQCKLFANAFQLFDRFISTIEPMGVAAKKLYRYIMKDNPYYDDSDVPPIPAHPENYQNVGSKTWSSQGNVNSSKLDLDSQGMEKPKLLQSDLTPSGHSNSSMGFSNNSAAEISSINATQTKVPSSSITNFPISFTFSPLLFTFPNFETFESASKESESVEMQMPLSPINLISKELQNLLMPHFDNKHLLPNLISIPIPSIMIPDRLGPADTWKLVRKRRSNDYYDTIEEENESTKTTGVSENSIPFNDDLQIKIDRKKSKMNRKGILECLKLLED